MLTPEAIRSQSAQSWGAKLAALHSHHTNPSDPRYRECLTALAYHRAARNAAAAVDGGFMSRQFATEYLSALAQHLCDPAASRQLGGFIDASVSV